MPANPRAANFRKLTVTPDTNFDINCQLIEYGETKHNEKGNRYQECVLFDGEAQEKVKIQEGRNGLPLEEKNKDEWLTFSLSARRGTGKWKDNFYYGGFWDSSAPVVDAPPQAQQAPQKAAGATNAPYNALHSQEKYPRNNNQKEVDWKAISRGKVRHGVVCAFIAAPIDEMPAIADIEYWVEYIMSGKDPNETQNLKVKPCSQCGGDEMKCACVPF